MQKTKVLWEKMAPRLMWYFILKGLSDSNILRLCMALQGSKRRRGKNVMMSVDTSLTYRAENIASTPLLRCRSFH